MTLPRPRGHQAPLGEAIGLGLFFPQPEIGPIAIAPTRCLNQSCDFKLFSVQIGVLFLMPRILVTKAGLIGAVV